MKDKINVFYIILGIGIGIIVTSLIFILKPKIKYVDYSDDEIIKKAKELGMVSVKEKIELNEEKDKRETDEKEDAKEEIILFRVENDDTLTSVADRLLKKELIANKEDFIQFAKYKEADKKLRTGDYKLEKNSSYNEIIKILIKSE